MSDPKENTPDAKSNIDIKYRIKAAAFLTIIGGVGLLAGFGGAVATVKNPDTKRGMFGLSRDLLQHFSKTLIQIL